MVFREDVTATELLLHLNYAIYHLSWTRVIDNDFNKGCLCIITEVKRSLNSNSL